MATIQLAPARHPGTQQNQRVFPVSSRCSPFRGMAHYHVHAQSPNHVQLFVTPWTVARQALLSMGILQARLLEWVAMSSSRGCS